MTGPGSEHAPLTRRRRLPIAVLVACAAAGLATAYGVDKGTLHVGGADFDQVWYAARALMHGGDPYVEIGPRRAFDLQWPFFYPLPTAVASLPFAPLPAIVARVLFVAASAGILTYALLAWDTRYLPLLGSSAFLISVSSAQWTPLLTAGVLLPSLAWAFVLKPNVGIPLLLTVWNRRSWRVAVVAGGILTVIAWVLVPPWVAEWLAALRTSQHFLPPVLAWAGGPLLLLALLRWRRWEARLLLAIAIAPQTAAIYSVLPLGLVAATVRQSLAFAAFTHVATLAHVLLVPVVMDVRLQSQIAQGSLVLVVYLPCLFLILQRPNEGPVPPWVDAFYAKVAGAIESNATRRQRAS